MTEVTMQAGRELDALVAAKVMGYVLEVRRYVCDRSGWFEVSDAASEYNVRCIPENEACGYLPRYSTDIAAAWEVVEEIQRRGWAVSVNLPWRDDRPDEPYAEIMQQPTFGSEGRFLAVGTTAPHAICLAALKAVGVDV